MAMLFVFVVNVRQVGESRIHRVAFAIKSTLVEQFPNFPHEVN